MVTLLRHVSNNRWERVRRSLRASLKSCTTRDNQGNIVRGLLRAFFRVWWLVAAIASSRNAYCPQQQELDVDDDWWGGLMMTMMMMTMRPGNWWDSGWQCNNQWQNEWQQQNWMCGGWPVAPANQQQSSGSLEMTMRHWLSIWTPCT